MTFHVDSERHIYTLDGARLPSVTEVLQPLTDLEGIPRAVLETAAERGRHVHAACHLFNQGALDNVALDPALAPYVAAWASFLFQTEAVVVSSERAVYHRAHGYAGTLDAIAIIRDRRELIDIKATAEIPRTVGPQTAAYAEALGEPRIRRRVVQLLPTGRFRTEKLDDRADWNVFHAALICHKFIRRKAA